MFDGEPFKQGPLVGVDRPLRSQELGDRPRLVAGPRPKGGNQNGLVDQSVLKGEQADQQVAVRGVPAIHLQPPS